MKTLLIIAIAGMSLACGCNSPDPNAASSYQELQRSFDELHEINNELRKEMEMTVKELSASAFTLGYYNGYSAGVRMDFSLQEDSAKYVNDIYALWK